MIAAKIPRAHCKQLNVRFPIVVFGFVEKVLFMEIRAVFKITAVQDDSVHLPEIHDVALEDLWSTCLQENSELNFERTVDALDQLRFFYTLIWMPWDNENGDDLRWIEQTLELHIRLVFDLRQRNIERSLVAYLRSLSCGSKYIQNQLDRLEQDVSVNSVSEKARLTDLLQLRLQLSTIRIELEILVNPDLRHIYQEMRTMLIILNAAPSIFFIYADLPHKRMNLSNLLKFVSNFRNYYKSTHIFF